MSESGGLDQYVDIEDIMPDHICTTCGAWIDEEDIEDVSWFTCPECSVSTSKTRTRVDPDEYGDTWPPYKRRVVRI